MPVPYASHLEAPLGIVRPTLRDAALRILTAHGRDLQSGSYPVRYAGVAGLKVFYFTGEPGVIARRGPGNWSTPLGTTPDAVQHLIDIDADPPPMKWSALWYGFEPGGRIDVEEATQA